MLWSLNFCEDQIFMEFVGFLSMIIYVVLYSQCLKEGDMEEFILSLLCKYLAWVV